MKKVFLNLFLILFLVAPLAFFIETSLGSEGQARFLWAGLAPAWFFFCLGILALAKLGAYAQFGEWRGYRQSPEFAEARRIAVLRQETERQEKRTMKQVAAVARRIRPDVIRALARYGIAYVYERRGAAVKTSKPQIRHVLYTREALYLRIDRLPFRQLPNMVSTPEMAHNLALAIGRECRWVSDVGQGLFLKVSLGTGLAGVPRFFPWYTEATKENAAELLPTKTRPMTVAIGLGENQRFSYEDFRDWPHLLVAGATGGGKSNFLRQMLCSLITNNQPEKLQIILIDLKGGLEFFPFREIPHLRQPVIYKKDEIAAALQELMREKERRFNLLRGAGLNNIKGWNSTRPNKLPYIMVVFDEIASLMLLPELKKQIETLVDDLAQQGRAVGLHLVLCTQIPTKSVISTIIRGNIPSRVAFTTDHTGSMIILGNKGARDLPPGGRAIYRHTYQTELQVPFITDKQVEEAIQKAIDPNPTEFDETDLFVLAWENYGGKFATKEIYDAVREHGISKYKVEKVAKNWEYSPDNSGPVIEMNGDRYILAPNQVSTNGSTGRFLLPVNGNLPSAEEIPGLVFEAIESRIPNPDNLAPIVHTQE